MAGILCSLYFNSTAVEKNGTLVNNGIMVLEKVVWNYSVSSFTQNYHLCKGMHALLAEG